MRRSSSSPLDRALGGAMIGAPLLLLASSVAYATEGGINNGQVGGAIQVYAMALWFLVVVGLARLVAGAFPRAATVLLVLGTLGVAAGVAFGVDSIHRAGNGVTIRGLGVGPAVLNTPGLLFPLALLGLGLVWFRAKIEPRWAGVLLAVAAVLFPASRIPAIAPLAIAADACFLIALAPLGWTLLRGRQPARAAG